MAVKPIQSLLETNQLSQEAKKVNKIPPPHQQNPRKFKSTDQQEVRETVIQSTPKIRPEDYRTVPKVDTGQKYRNVPLRG